MCKISYAFFLGCLALFSSVGCKPNHQYIYEKFEVSSDDLSCSISLSGSEQHVGVDKESGISLSYFRSPYTILVSFHFPKEQSGLVELRDISFYSNGLKFKTEQVNRKEEFDNITEFRKGGVLQLREEDESRASFLIKQIEIPHSELKVTVTALILTDDGEVLKTWEFELTPFTEKELRNDLHDSLMSV